MEMGPGCRQGDWNGPCFVVASITWPVPQQRIHHHDLRGPAVDRPMGKPGGSQST